MADESPWQGIPLAELHTDPHDSATCPVCAPLATPAGLAGAARALEVQTHLPMSSAAAEPRPGRDGYELPD